MRGLLTSILLLTLATTAGAQCKCSDKDDIQERLKLISAAVNAYGKELSRIGGARYTPQFRATLQGRVGRAMGEARTPGRPALVAEGGTTNNCSIEDVHAPSPCLEAAIRAHEKVHQDACNATLETHRPLILKGQGADRFEALGFTMSGYIVEEVTGYQAESAFLVKELARLNRDCKPPPQRHYTPAQGTHLRDENPPQADHATPGKPRPIAPPPPMPQPKPLPTPTPY